MRPVAYAQYLSIFGDAPQGREVLTVLEAARRKSRRRKAALRKKAARRAERRAGGKVAKGRRKVTLPKAPRDKVRKPKERKGVSAHNPFRGGGNLGPTTVYKVAPPAPPPRKTRKHKETGCWKCHRVGKYMQDCEGQCKKNRGKTVRIRIKPDYKKTYNKAYKRHRTLKRAGAHPKED